MEARLIDIETRLAFQEDGVESLSTTVARQQEQIDRMLGLIQRLQGRIEDLGSGQDAGTEPESPPPHY